MVDNGRVVWAMQIIGRYEGIGVVGGPIWIILP
jgi:hypothetical protein